MFDLGTLATNADPPIARARVWRSTVVGSWSAHSGQTGAVIWQPDAGGTYIMSDLNSLIPSGTGWRLREARAINDAGLIVVDGRCMGARVMLFLLTPQTTAADWRRQRLSR